VLYFIGGMNKLNLGVLKMKKITTVLSSLVLALVGMHAYAANPNCPSDTQFQTASQEQACCPPATKIAFAQIGPGVDGEGALISAQNQAYFISYDDNTKSSIVLHPKVVEPNSMVDGVVYGHTFESNDFGRITNNLVTCYYTYTGFTGVTVFAIMEGTQQQ
jgi:hypothetical protein